MAKQSDADFNADVDDAVGMDVATDVEDVPLSLETCIFCSVTSISFEENLKHMSKSHSLFIPDIEFITDLTGLIQHLQAKVSEGKICLQCNGKGRSFNSIAAVRKHMIDKGHC